MDKDRSLYFKDEKGVEYLFNVIGLGVPAQFMIETSKEREEARKQFVEVRKKANIEIERRKREKKDIWYKKLLIFFKKQTK